MGKLGGEALGYGLGPSSQHRRRLNETGDDDREFESGFGSLGIQVRE